MNSLTKAFYKHVVKRNDTKKFEQVKRLKQYSGQKVMPFFIVIKAMSYDEALKIVSTLNGDLKFVKRIANNSPYKSSKYIFVVNADS